MDVDASIVILQMYSSSFLGALTVPLNRPAALAGADVSNVVSSPALLSSLTAAATCITSGSPSLRMVT